MPTQPNNLTRYHDYMKKTDRDIDQSYKARNKEKTYISFATCNCNKGLLDSNNNQTSKMIEMENYLNDNEIDALIVNESDIYGKDARIRRTNPYTEETLNTKLKIEKYNLWLPKQWCKHDQARTVIYTREHLSVTQVNYDDKYDDLPVVILDIGQQGIKKTRVCDVYREYKGGVSGLETSDAQQERMQRTK